MAIDGPAGAGKSTIARRLASVLGLAYVNTGDMYRAMALATVRGSVDPRDGTALGDLARRTAVVLRRGRELRPHVLLDGEDVTDRLRDPAVEQVVSLVARCPEVREVLVAAQRRLAAEGGVVVEGRDIGTSVLPQADFKFFVTADIHVRAKRRWKQLRAQAVHLPLAEVERDIAERDALDAGRSVGPLLQSADATLIDTTALSIREAVERVAECVAASHGSGTR